MRRLSLPLVILLSIVIAACLTSLALAQGTDRKDEVVTETTPLAPFKRIDISGSAIIVLVQDTNGPLVATVPKDNAARVSVRVQKGTLMVKAADGGRWYSNLFGRGPAGTPQLTIHFKDLEGIDVSGVVRISAKEIRVPALSIDGSGGTTIQIDDLRATSLSVDGSGALKAELAGQVTSQSISVSGAADYQAVKLVSDSATVEVSGAGKIVVNARKKLDATISGAGVVEYLGDPVVQQSISGAGRVKRRETAEASVPPIALRD
jgi:Putative auto-transporter adhesin, head GIN domain